MLMKTSELIGPALDWAVAKCEGVEWGCSNPKMFLVDIAVMRCYVAFKLGDEIDIPEELST